MKHCFLLATIILGLFSCKENPIFPEIRNYLPLEKGSEIKFNRVGIATTYPFVNKDSLIGLTDYVSSKTNAGSSAVVRWKYEKDTMVDGKSYAKITDKGMSPSLYRKEKGVYYAKRLEADLPHSEVVFLRDKIEVGDTWESSYLVQHSEVRESYKVSFVKKEVKVQNKVYNNVVSVRCDIITAGGSYPTKVTYYADGLGEIYSYVEYPKSERYEHNKFYKSE